VRKGDRRLSQKGGFHEYAKSQCTTRRGSGGDWEGPLITFWRVLFLLEVLNGDSERSPRKGRIHNRIPGNVNLSSIGTKGRGLSNTQ